MIDPSKHALSDLPIIARYSRAQALADGVLTSANLGDLATTTAQHCAALVNVPPVAIGEYLRNTMLAAVAQGSDLVGIWHDILSVATATGPCPAENFGHLFHECFTTGEPCSWSFRVRIGGRDELVICDIGPGDSGEPVVTFMALMDG